MAWVWLGVAGVLEIVWAYALKQSAGFAKPVEAVVAVIAMIASFVVLSLAMKSLPLGTAYTIWTGIGAVGAFLLGVMVARRQGRPKTPPSQQDQEILKSPSGRLARPCETTSVSGLPFRQPSSRRQT
jgi:quaternary ammonium compound-resistance protein SugE